MTVRRPTVAGRPIGALSPAIQPSAAYIADGPDALDQIYEGVEPGYTYSREGHPNATRVATMLDEMEGYSGGIVTGSGMSAIGAMLLGCLKSGDHVIGGIDVYLNAIIDCIYLIWVLLLCIIYEGSN